MSIVSGQNIRLAGIFEPFAERTVHNGMSYGLSAAGYDIRFGGDVGYLMQPGAFLLATSLEHFDVPVDMLGMVADKSTWARRGIAVQNTIIEPGWRGYLTLEITNHGSKEVLIQPGDPIAQIIFHWLDQPAERPYDGKYQDQPNVPVEAIAELDHNVQ